VRIEGVLFLHDGQSLEEMAKRVLARTGRRPEVVVLGEGVKVEYSRAGLRLVEAACPPRHLLLGWRCGDGQGEKVGRDLSEPLAGDERPAGPGGPGGEAANS